MKKLLTICVSFILLFGFGSVAFGVFGDPFISIQLGNTPVANNILTTDGTDNIWSDGITLDTVTSTNLFFSNATGTNSLYVGDGTNGWKMGNK